MKKGLVVFLQVAVAALGIGILGLMLWEPHLEGRNVNATFFEIYFTDPFLAFAYLGSIPFFVALYKIVKVLGYAGQNKLSSPEAISALKTIKYCALTTAGAIVAADIFLMISARSSGEDADGAIMLGIIATFICVVIAATASKFRKV